MIIGTRLWGARCPARAVTVLLAAVLALGMGAVPGTGEASDQLSDTAALQTVASSAVASPVEAQLLALANADRVANGLPPLGFDPALLAIARVRALAQLTPGTASHYDADGNLAFVGLFDAANIDFTLAGENLARLWDGPEAATTAELALMGSAAHRKNILEPLFSDFAVGVATDGAGQVAFAQLFRTLS
jgi:uncharacterized protein YkwD